MEFTVLFMVLMFATLIYLHIRQSDLIFQNDIKVAKTLSVILFFIVVGKSWVPAAKAHEPLQVFGVFCIAATCWILMILIYWRILSACQKDAFLKKIGKPNQPLRDKIKELLLGIIELNHLTTEFIFFTETYFEDPAVNDISDECRKIATHYPKGGTTVENLAQEDIDKINSLIEQLNIDK
ncbi:MAG: hypothetical protein ACYSUT_04745 [Planctomycetota bacterium]|jgi:hypothetical protein